MILDHFFYIGMKSYHKFIIGLISLSKPMNQSNDVGGGRFIQRNQSMKFIKEIKKTNSYFCWLLSASFQWLFSSRIQIDESI